MHGYSKKGTGQPRAGAYGNAVHFPHRGPVPRKPSAEAKSQRTALARALALAPQVLLLDEPFSALDPATRQSLYQELRRIHRHFGCTIVFVTHDFLEARTLAGRAAILLDGELQTVTDTARLMDGHFSAEVERFLGRNQIITAPERKKEKRIIQ